MTKTTEEVLGDIKNNPDKHQHRDMNELLACCTICGAIDASLVDAHGQYASQGKNGGVDCDVASGPCACGAWH